MSSVVRRVSATPWRVKVWLDSSFSGWMSGSSYVFTRQDGAYTAIQAETVWQADTLIVEMTLSEPLESGTVYVVTIPGGSSLPFSAFAPAQPFDESGTVSDPLADVLGLDLNIFAEDLDGGDIPAVTGVDCLRLNLADLCFIIPGEIIHRPLDGLGIQRKVNSTSVPSAQDEIRGTMQLAFLEDARVKDATVGVLEQSKGSGTWLFPVRVLTRALDSEVVSLPIPVS